MSTDRDAAGAAMSQSAHPPETLEGWYALHQLFALPALPAHAAPASRDDASARASFLAALEELACPPAGGWSLMVPLIGSRADVMFIHFRPTLDDVGVAQRRLRHEPFVRGMTSVYTFLSVTEAGLYHLTAQLARAAAERGGAVGDDAYKAALADKVRAELPSPHLQRRLFPPRPAEMPYVSFYPMTKRRAPGQNWYALSLDERSRLMQAHGLTGRRYAGRVMQVITGAIGLDAWEWGVTLFAKDPLDLKKLVTDMRFDEVSAQYADFGEFFVGKVGDPAEWLASLPGA